MRNENEHAAQERRLMRQKQAHETFVQIVGRGHGVLLLYPRRAADLDIFSATARILNQEEGDHETPQSHETEPGGPRNTLNSRNAET